ncbi:MAG: alpha/beta fold hydrolase [Cyanobacteria bacterium J06638_22]
MASNTVRFLKQSHPARLDRPLFVFLPGMDGTGELFETQLGGLQQEMDVRCLAIPSDDTTPWEELARATAELIRLERAAAPRRPVYVCGESFGGCLALTLARYAPNSLDYLILVNPASSFSRQLWGWWSSDMVRSIPSPLYGLSAIALVPLLTNIDRVSDENRKALLRAMQSVTQRSAAWRLSLVGQFDLDSIPLHRITQPTLVLASTGDRLLPSVEESERLLQRLPNARRVILPDSGHACLLETDVNLGKILSAQQFLTYPLLAS